MEKNIGLERDPVLLLHFGRDLRGKRRGRREKRTERQQEKDQW